MNIGILYTIIKMEQQYINQIKMYKKFLKANLLFVLLIILTISVYGQKHPFSVTKIPGDIYFDESEINVASWLSFYSWTLKHEGLEEAKKLLPDSNAILPALWVYINQNSSDYLDIKARYSLQPIGYFDKNCKECEKFSSVLLKRKKICPMLDFPITGINYDQAVAYCKWRTKVEGNNEWIFRLPTPLEWKELAITDLSVNEQNIGFKDSINKKGSPNFNYAFKKCNCDIDNYQGKLNGIGTRLPGKSMKWEVFGNVAEMTSEKGIAKGGSYINYAKQCHPDSVQHYTKPEAWLGFRCIAVAYNEGVSNTDSNYIKIQGPLREIENSDLFVDSRDGKVYPTIIIGNQTWLASNLAYEPDSGKYWVYKHRKKKVDRLGYLYSFEVAQDVCPTGWHLPSKSEYEILLQEFTSPYVAYKELILSGNSGFSMINVGIHAHGEFIEYYDNSSKFWTSTEASDKKGNSLLINGSKSEAIIHKIDAKKWGLSVRCIKDDE